MAVHASGTALTFTEIRNEYFGILSVSDSDLYNLNFYRGKTYFRANGVPYTFQSANLDFFTFYSSYAVDPSPPPPPPVGGP